MSIGLVTAIFDDYDTLKPQYTNAQEAVCVTDNPELRADGWTVKVVKRPLTETGRQACKHPKVFPWLYLRHEHDVIITVDGSFDLKHEDIYLGGYLPPGEILGQWPNMFRDCAYDEASVSATIDKYQDDRLWDQTRYYQDCGLPAHAGLWSCGIIFRRDVPKMREFEVRWYQELCRWGVQDQISHAFLCWDMGITPFRPEGQVTENAFATWRGHLK